MAFEIDFQTRRLTYPVWLRLFTAIAAIAAALLLFNRSSLSINTNPDLPWNEEFRIINDSQTLPKKPKEHQPQLTETLRYKMHPEQNGFQCGNLNFLIQPDGIVKGVWNGEYEQHASGESTDNSGTIHRVIMAASFIGNIDPSKPCFESGKRDPSKLYFIASGTFTLYETQTSAGYGRNVYGYVYVRGWLDPNDAGLGELIITENKKSFETFTWMGQSVN